MIDPETRAGPATGEVRPVSPILKPRFNTAEASTYLRDTHGLKLAVATLEKMRSVGGGPPFVHFGRSVAYERSGIDDWVAERISQPRRSTSEAGG